MECILCKLRLDIQLLLIVEKHRVKFIMAERDRNGGMIIINVMIVMLYFLCYTIYKYHLRFKK